MTFDIPHSRVWEFHTLTRSWCCHCLLNNGDHAAGSAVVPHWSCNLHYPDDPWWWASNISSLVRCLLPWAPKTLITYGISFIFFTKISFWFFCQFLKIGLFSFSCDVSALCVFQTQALYQILVQISSLSWTRLLICSSVSCKKQNLSISWSLIYYLFFYEFYLGNVCQNQCHKYFMSFNCFIVLKHTCFPYMEWSTLSSFLCVAWGDSRGFYSCVWCPIAPAPLLRILTFPIGLPWPLYWKSFVCDTVGPSPCSQFCPSDLYVCPTPIPYCVYYCCFLLNLEIRWCKSSNSVLFQNHFDHSRPFEFPDKF